MTEREGIGPAAGRWESSLTPQFCHLAAALPIEDREIVIRKKLKEGKKKTQSAEAQEELFTVFHFIHSKYSIAFQVHHN